MLFLYLTLFLLLATKCNQQNQATRFTVPSAAFKETLFHIDELKNLAQFGDAQHRGPSWYDHKSESGESGSDLKSEITDTSASSLSSDTGSSGSWDSSSDASSAETREKKLATRVYRTCTPCPHDMLKIHTNIGIKWICGAYQRARRTFKSECMMRYRNCQDGTMFVKIYDHRCKDDSFHGKHWFYVYSV